MTLRQRDITIEVREIPLPFLRLHVGPDYIGVPKAPGTERDSRPGCRLREMVYVQAEEGKWNGLARRHEPCRARPTLPQLDRDRSQDQQREKAQRRPRRRRHAARPPFEWRSEEHTSELQSRLHLVCRLLLEKKKPNLQSY